MPRRRKSDFLDTNIKKWKVGIYCRLSSDDGDNAESDSIKNQRELIAYYLKKEEDIKIIDFYADDGFSGTSFNRPDFKRMFNDIVNGRINTIIVKDLSRFGRNFTEVGNYIEQIFPLYNIRFISINDNVDSYKDPKSINNVIVPFKNLVNDEYARDISNKVKSALLTKARNGEFVGGTTPYGYIKDPNDIHHLIINEDEAKNVRSIFQMALEGDGALKICKYLNDNYILCRKEIQRRNKYNIDLNSKTENSRYKWSKTTIQKMLTDETYIGNLIYNKTGAISYKNHKQVAKPKEEWIIVEGTHEGIIDKKDFEKIKELKDSRKSVKKRPEQPSIYGWKIKCADCGHAMCRMEDYRDNRSCSNFYCRSYKTQSSMCSPHKIKTSDLNNIVLKSILFQIKLVLDLEKTIEKLKRKSTEEQIEKEFFHEIKKMNNDIEKFKRIKKSSYEDWKFEKITKEEFLNYSKDYDERIKTLEKEIEAMKNIYVDKMNELKKGSYWIEHFRRNKKIKSLSKEVINEIVDSIYVHKDGDITIKFKYQDEFEKTLEFMGKEMN